MTIEEALEQISVIRSSPSSPGSFERTQEQIRAVLQQLAGTAMLPVFLPISVIKFCASCRDGEVAKACRAALEQYNDKR